MSPAAVQDVRVASSPAREPRRSARRRPLSSYAARMSFDMLDGIGRHDQVAVVRLERWLRARGYDEAVDRPA